MAPTAAIAVATTALALALAAPATAAESLTAVQPERLQIAVQSERGRLVGRTHVLVRNRTGQPGRVRVRYLRDSPAQSVALAVAAGSDSPVQLVDPVSGTPVTSPPLVGAGATEPLSLRASLPKTATPSRYDGRVVAQLETPSGQAVGDPLVATLDFREVRGTSAFPWGTAIAAFSALGAAVAAFLSWWSVHETREARREDQLPKLSLTGSLSPKKTSLTVINTGGGIARVVHCCLVAGDVRRYGPAGDGVLLPGEQRTLVAGPTANDHFEAVVFCTDFRGDWYVWGYRAGQRKTLPGPKVDYGAAFARIYGRDPWRDGVEFTEGFL
jgi:hypothetical protein